MDLRQDPEENHAVLVGSGEIFCEGWIIGAIQKSSVSSQRGVMAIVLDEERRVQEEARAMWDLEVALFEGSALLMVICVHSSCNGSPNITVKSSQVMPNRVWWALDKVDSERLHSTPNTSRGNDSRDGYWEDGCEVRFVFCTFCLLSSRAEKDHEKEVG